MTTYILNCGHTATIASHLLGKGHLRQRRIATQSNGICDACHNERLITFASKLTKLDGSHYTPVEQQAYVEKRSR